MKKDIPQLSGTPLEAPRTPEARTSGTARLMTRLALATGLLSACGGPQPKALTPSQDQPVTGASAVSAPASGDDKVKDRLIMGDEVYRGTARCDFSSKISGEALRAAALDPMSDYFAMHKGLLPKLWPTVSISPCIDGEEIEGRVFRERVPSSREEIFQAIMAEGYRPATYFDLVTLAPEVKLSEESPLVGMGTRELDISGRTGDSFVYEPALTVDGAGARGLIHTFDLKHYKHAYPLEGASEIGWKGPFEYLGVRSLNVPPAETDELNSAFDDPEPTNEAKLSIGPVSYRAKVDCDLNPPRHMDDKEHIALMNDRHLDRYFVERLLMEEVSAIPCKDGQKIEARIFDPMVKASREAISDAMLSEGYHPATFYELVALEPHIDASEYQVIPPAYDHPAMVDKSALVGMGTSLLDHWGFTEDSHAYQPALRGPRPPTVDLVYERASLKDKYKYLQQGVKHGRNLLDYEGPFRFVGVRPIAANENIPEIRPVLSAMKMIGEKYCQEDPKSRAQEYWCDRIYDMVGMRTSPDSDRLDYLRRLNTSGIHWSRQVSTVVGPNEKACKALYRKAVDNMLADPNIVDMHKASLSMDQVNGPKVSCLTDSQLQEIKENLEFGLRMERELQTFGSTQ